MPNLNINLCVGEPDFYKRVNAELKFAKPKQYALVSLDFDNFNFINDLFGFNIGNRLLNTMEKLFGNGLQKGEFFTRAHADHFILFVKAEEHTTIASRLEELILNTDIVGSVIPEHYALVCSGGIVIIDNPEERLTLLLDKANFSRKKAKGNHRNTFLYYDKNVSEELEWKKKITLSMQSSMQNREFEMFLQPKISLENGKVVGAEALARWNSKNYGFIMPGNFIPVFEQNGFVKVLDFFMLNEACRFVKEYEAAGFVPFPISVNFSKLHISTPAFAQRVFKIVRDYGIAAKYIEIELTESVVSSNFHALITTITQLKQLGFLVSIDDFGSAYSSLNHLKELPLDTIKIDRAFLNSLSGNSKSIVVLKSIIDLARSLNMCSLIEGVETQDQVELMKSLGCDIVQGFFYAKPMDKARFISYLNNNALTEIPSASDFELIKTELEIQKTTWTVHNILEQIDMGIIKAYIDKEACIQFVNTAALKISGYTRSELRALINDNFLNLVSEQSRAVLMKSVINIYKTHGAMEYKLTITKKDKTETVIAGRACYTEDENHRPMCIYMFRDISEGDNSESFLSQTLTEQINELETALALQTEKRRELENLNKLGSIVQDIAEIITFEWDFETDSFNVSPNYEELMGRKPICKNISKSPELLMRFHPDDRAAFRRWTEAIYNSNGSSTAELRHATVDGRYIWMRLRAVCVCSESGMPVKAVGMLANIDRQKKELALLEQKSQYDPLTHLYNKEEVQIRIDNELQNQYAVNSAMLIIDIDNFKGVNDNLGHQFGDNVLKELASEITRMFDQNCIAGRIGGDEFVIFICNVSAEENIARRAQPLLDAMRKTYYGEDKKYKVSCSMGAAVFPRHGKSFNELYRVADIALYNAKANGKDCCVVYSNEMTGERLPSLTPLDSKNTFLDTYFSGDTIFNIFEMLYETKDITTTVVKILELVGQSLNVDRAYIFEYTADKQHISNTFEWCAPTITPEIDELQNVPLESYSVFPKNFNSEGLHVCPDIETMDELSYEILHKQNIKSVLQCALHTDGELMGFVGFDDCQAAHNWRGDEIATLGYISRILSVFLTKSRITKELLESYENYKQMVYNLNGYVYVIDTETYELLYINKPMEDIGICVGQKCYEAAFGTDLPCDSCPAKCINFANPKADRDIFSVKLSTWVNAAASILTWTDGRTAALICCTEIKSTK